MKTVGIYPNTDKDTGLVGTQKVIDAFGGRAKLLIQKGIGRLDGAVGVTDKELFTESEAVIVLGGDGTLLEAARHCAPLGIPLLGINLGRIGYMAEIELDELHLLNKLVCDDYKIEKRMMLDAKIDTDSGSFALNDVVIGAESIFSMVELELNCDSLPVNKYRADGLIISTPTGSTAYSLSAGGAVLDPRMDAMIVTPICSHSLSATPIVFSGESELEVKNVSLRESHLVVSIDGCVNYKLDYGHSVKIRRSGLQVKFLRLKDGGFYQVLRHKMAEKL